MVRAATIIVSTASTRHALKSLYNFFEFTFFVKGFGPIFDLYGGSAFEFVG